MLSGELDGHAAKSLPNGLGLCRWLIAEFIAKGTAQDLRTSCANKIERPRFAKDLPARYAR
jgi:hypothetical protein